MARQRAASGFNTKMLLENGCCDGSGLYMTENAFLTDSWLEMTPNVIRGYRNMSYTKENKDWWIKNVPKERKKAQQMPMFLCLHQEKLIDSINQIQRSKFQQKLTI
jgi:hypothetical protein